MLLLTDMFGGTPSNLGLAFLEAGRIEVVTGVNLPMLIKLAKAPRRAMLTRGARDLCEHGRAAIRVASDLLRADRDPAGPRGLSDVAADDDRQRARPARARGGAVREAGGHVREPDPRDARRSAPWTARASSGCCCSPRRAGQCDRHRADGPDEAAGARRARARSSSEGSRTHDEADGPRRVAGHGGRPGASSRCATRARSATGWRPAASIASASGCARRASARASSSRRSRRACRARSARRRRRSSRRSC